MLKKPLSAISPQDKPWKIHKVENLSVANIYLNESRHVKKGARMLDCSGFLEFGEQVNKETGEVRLKLIRARFCRVRYCPICQWRRSLFWRARFYKALPDILALNHTARFIFLTLTVKNCHVSELRETLKAMSKSWQRFIKRKEFTSVIGWVRSTEVTREKDDPKRGFIARQDFCHPHFHCLLMMPSSYFSGGFYIKQEKWAAAWKGALRADYDPVVDVRTVKPKKITMAEEVSPLPKSGILETLKYSVKPQEMLSAPEWFIAMTEQTHKLRFIATGGALKDILKPEEKISNDELIHLGEEVPKQELVDQIFRFLWNDEASDYFLAGHS